MAEQIVHVIETGGLTLGQESGGLQGAGGKDLLGLRGVTQFNPLVSSGEKDLMVTGNGTPPNGGDADFMALSGLSDGVSVPHVFRLIGQSGGEGIGQQQGSAAGGVYFPIVVALHNLDVKVFSQQLGRLTGQLGQHIDAQREIGGAEDGDGPGGRLDLQELSLRVAGGG